MKEFSGRPSLIKQPGAWIPLAISFTELSFLLGYVAIYGFTNQTNGDEGAPARIFQLLMAVQIPFIMYFALRWLPKQPKQALSILVLQAAAWIIPVLTVLVLENL